MISSYFLRTGLKRNHSSTSDESDVSISSENDSKKQEKKRMNTVAEDSDMAVQTELHNISKRLDTLATKVDVEQMRDEVKFLTKTFMEKLENQDRRIKQNERELNDLQQYSGQAVGIRFFSSSSFLSSNSYVRFDFSSQTCLLFQRKIVFILSDSLSSLQSIFNLKYDHPILVQILELYTEMTRDGREIFIWVPGHVGIRGNSAGKFGRKQCKAASFETSA